MLFICYIHVLYPFECSHLWKLPFIQTLFLSMKFITYIMVHSKTPWEATLKSGASLLSPFHTDFARQNPSRWLATLVFYDMNLSSIIQVHSSLSCIQNTVSNWNCKEIKSNKGICDVCQDIHQTCHSMLEIVNRLVSCSQPYRRKTIVPSWHTMPHELWYPPELCQPKSPDFPHLDSATLLHCILVITKF